MVLTILIAFASLIGLIVLHEFGHFIVAKKFGVKVEEFGIGFPPRLFGKKIGETVYSLNLLPFGAFVKLYGEEERIEDLQSFSKKPIWQRILIVFGGVVSFWIVAIIILTLVAGIWGLPTVVKDEHNHTLIDPKVQIVTVLKDSPAEKAGLKVGDVIASLKLKTKNEKLKTDKVKQVVEFIEIHKGQEIVLEIERGKELFEVTLVPRISPPEKEGPIGVGLVRTALKPHSWIEAPFQGILLTGALTANIISGWIMGLKSIMGIAELPPGVKLELRGPIGILDYLRKYFAEGINYFLYLIALISVAVALINILPIPALDGGKLIFLGIEKIRKKPVSSKTEQKITTFFFALLIALMIWVTIKDIFRLF